MYRDAKLLFTIIRDGVSSQYDSTGTWSPCWCEADDGLRVMFYIPPGSPVYMIEDNKSDFVKVLTQNGVAIMYRPHLSQKE